MIITIDGPSGTGKSSVAKELARKLQFSFFDTGALYRSLAWWAFNQGIEVEEALASFNFRIDSSLEKKRYFIGEVEVTDEIRSKKITERASKIAAIKEVRSSLLPLQRNYAKEHDSVFEGRDLGSVVFPKADVKIFLFADPRIRAKRRHKEFLLKNPSDTTTVEEFQKVMEERDEQDSSRAVAPLKCPEGALSLDTSSLTMDEVVDTLLKYVLDEKKRCGAG
jgi:CMP/dCMP kinase